MRSSYFFKCLLGINVLCGGFFQTCDVWAIYPDRVDQKRAGDDDDESRDKRFKLEFKEDQEAIKKAVETASSSQMTYLYNHLQKLKLSSDEWQEQWRAFQDQKGRVGRPLWNPEGLDTYRNSVLGALFLEASVNAPHLQLIKNALQPLLKVADERWDRVYAQRLSRIQEIIGLHHYIRRTGGLYGLVASSGFQNPIASLIFVEALKSLWEESINLGLKKNNRLGQEDLLWFDQARKRIGDQLRNNRVALGLFLQDTDPRYMDLPESLRKAAVSIGTPEGIKKEIRLLLDEKAALGLPYYHWLKACTFWKPLAGGACTLSEYFLDLEAFLNRLTYYEKALEGQDPRGGYGYCDSFQGLWAHCSERVNNKRKSFFYRSIMLGDPMTVRLSKDNFGKIKTEAEKNKIRDMISLYGLRYPCLLRIFEDVQPPRN